ncbi:hypothetical protein EVU97_00520 [Dermacoccus sp. 147Ba]|uniref:hypothetical protein n=1 Tax=Dermacoccus sp. 147Ba TaxID=2510111 RepID=UPI00101D9503|nr:hypothetical protein [Dermacoccus sp. 147Ba]RYI24242.1 hypothetical protein EVU97_00520 [Dermacoccus sp. 147Ba]
MAWEADVEAYRSQQPITLNELAVQHGWTYHQIYAVSRELGVLADAETVGRRTILTAEHAQTITAEVERRVHIEQTAMSVTEATMSLGLSAKHIAELIKQNILQTTRGPTHRSPRYVTRTSVEEYQERYPANRPEAAADEPTMPIVDVARLLGMSRQGVTALVQRRQLQTDQKGRRQHIVLRSVLDWADHTGLGDQVAVIRRHLDVQAPSS